MSEKYTYADVIIDPEDPRVEIGKEYYFGNNPTCLLKDISQLSAQEGKLMLKDSAIEAQSSPFMSSGNKWFVCIVRKKEKEKHYIPFDFTKEEDRAQLRGAWVRDKDSGREYAITGLFLDETPPYVELNDNGFEPDYLLENYEFVDGTPCGKLRKEEDNE